VRVAFATLGCRLNQVDSQQLQSALEARGFATVPFGAPADVVVVNTCSVTATADQGARQTIRRIARDNPRARIVVTGCYATRRPDEIAALPNVARVVCNDDKPRLLHLISAASADSTVSASFDGPCGAAVVPGVAGRTAYTLRIQTGCATTMELPAQAF